MRKWITLCLFGVCQVAPLYTTVADFISCNNINDTKKLDVLRFNGLELSVASYKHEDLAEAQSNDAKLEQVIEGI